MKLSAPLLLLSLLTAASGGSATAQGPLAGPGWQPLNDRLPPGYNAEILQRIRSEDASWMQPIRIELPSTGSVALHAGQPAPAAEAAAPAAFAIGMGHLYRLRLTELPEFPTAEFYPTIELLDRLHPPAGQEFKYPIPVVFTADDLKLAASGALVTRVIYLERPQTAASDDPLRRERPQTVAPGDNAIAAAEMHGRPLAIVRIGGRVPVDGQAPPFFFGSGGPATAAPEPAPEPRSASRNSQSNANRQASTVSN